MIDGAIDFLRSAQNADGGWGAVKGTHSNTESTSFAVMALNSLEDKLSTQQADAGLKWLLQHQKDDGSWVLNDTVKESSWSTPIAALAVLSFQDQRQHALRAAKWILTQEGRKAGWLASLLVQLSIIKKMTELDPFLSGWSWTAGAFSWVEPTSYSLMALKRLRHSLAKTNCEERIRQGEMLIYDRMCESGGWNYGNSKVLGEALWPYPDVTAVALIALQDQAASEANQKSLRALENMLREAPSGTALGWGILCLTVYNRDVEEWKRILVKSFEERKFLGETKAVALALLAVDGGATLFRI
ncbi:MAG TPA: prenyltransferase/squalene oxidase repeat-containing protein [Candidatus Binatia bacterium]